MKTTPNTNIKRFLIAACVALAIPLSAAAFGGHGGHAGCGTEAHGGAGHHLRRLLHCAVDFSSLNKPAGEPCRHLDGEFRCRIFGRPERPDCCAACKPSPEMCGESREQALNWLAELEVLTHPG
jgi:hypothetical protein